MTIRRYIASKDTTITNAFKENLVTRATTSNMGASDALEVFSIFAQADSGSFEASRVLLKFPVDNVKEDRDLGKIPQSGSVNFVLKLSNAVHPFTLPKDYSLVVNALSRSWDEGYGLDMESYKDIGQANWISASSTEAWTIEGGDFYSNPEFSQYFSDGTEDLEVDVTELVEKWISEEIPNYGVIVKLSSSLENEPTSYYTKKFFARGSEFFYKKPWIEARFDATVKDHRGIFYRYNPFVPMDKNYNTLYIHNVFRGQMYDLPTVGTGNVYVGLYPSIQLPLGSPLQLIDGSTFATGSWVSTGRYKVSLGVDTELEKLYDIWFDGNGDAIGFGGEIEIKNSDREQNFTKNEYSVTIKNIKQAYRRGELARFHLFIRDRDINLNSYTSLASRSSGYIAEDMYFKICRVVDNYEVIPYGNGTTNHTRLSFDKNGNYFDLDTSLLESGYSYILKFIIYYANEYHEVKDSFKFRVEE